MPNEKLMPNGWVLKETDTGRFQCQNLYVKDEAYHQNIINASIYGDEEEANRYAERMNSKAGYEWLVVLPVSLRVMEV